MEKDQKYYLDKVNTMAYSFALLPSNLKPLLEGSSIRITLCLRTTTMKKEGEIKPWFAFRTI